MIERSYTKESLERAFFDVITKPVYTLAPDHLTPCKLHNYKAIVHAPTGKAFSVVSSEYRLVDNRTAYKLADCVIRAVFPGKALSDFECFNIHMPRTGGSCRIDLIIPHNFKHLFGNTREAWTPFVRIANSYNRTCNLSYEIGFCRWICLNGCIFGGRSLKISQSHTDLHINDLEKSLMQRARNELGDMSAMWNEFERRMEALRNIYLPASSALSIFCKVFDIILKDEQIKENRRKVLGDKARQIINASKEYFDELGNNGYALMNVLTDFASHPAWTQSTGTYVDGYQHRVSRWVDSFIAETAKPHFSLAQYIGNDYQNTAYILEALVEKQ